MLLKASKLAQSLNLCWVCRPNPEYRINSKLADSKKFKNGHWTKNAKKLSDPKMNSTVLNQIFDLLSISQF